MPRSFRGVRDYALVRWGERAFHIDAKIYRFGNPHDISITVIIDDKGRTDKKIYKRDGRNVKTYEEIFKTFVVLSFSSKEHAFIDGPPSERRRFFDWALSLIDQDYFRHLMDYKRLIEEKKFAIKRDMDLSPWNKALIPYMDFILRKRREFVEMINDNISYNFLPEGFRIFYKPSLINPESIFRYEEEEKRRGFPIYGPHRDEFLITLEGKPVRIFASEGQKRRIHLGIILFLRKVLEERLGDKPVLVLDEPFVYLDPEGVEEVLSSLDGQVFISSAKPITISKNNMFLINLPPYN